MFSTVTDCGVLLELGSVVAAGTELGGSSTMLTRGLLGALEEELPFRFSLRAMYQQEKRREPV